MKTTKQTIEAIEYYIAFFCPPEKIGLAYKALGFQNGKLKYDKYKRQRNILIHPNRIIDTVCEFLDVKKDVLISKSRVRRVSDARHIALFLIYKYNKLSYREVGLYCNRDHSSVIHAIKAVNRLYDTNRGYKSELDELRLIFEK